MVWGLDHIRSECASSTQVLIIYFVTLNFMELTGSCDVGIILYCCTLIPLYFILPSSHVFYYLIMILGLYGDRWVYNIWSWNLSYICMYVIRFKIVYILYVTYYKPKKIHSSLKCCLDPICIINGDQATGNMGTVYWVFVNKNSPIHKFLHLQN